MDTLKRFLYAIWRPTLLVATLGVISYALYFHKLGTLLPGYSAPEVAAYQAAHSWSNLLHDPLNAPYKLLVLLLGIVGQQGLLATRIAAALCSLVAIVVFFFVARNWYGFRIAFLGSVLFATSSGFLHAARLGTPDILQLGILMLIGIIIWHRRSKRLKPLLTYAVIAIFAILAYVPGMIWLEIAAVVILHRQLIGRWQGAQLTGRLPWIATGSILILPLVISLASKPSLVWQLLGLPSDLSQITDIPTNLLQTILAVGVRSDGNALLWVGHMPLLNATELILGFLGMYYYMYRERSLRSLLLTVCGIISVVLASLGGAPTIAYVIPIAYLLIAGGLYHFLDEWLSVFPRNPIARSVGLTVIGILLLFSATHHLQSYFVAWPHTPATQAAFQLH